MRTPLRYRIAGLGVAVVVLLAGWGTTSPQHEATTEETPTERVAFSWWPSWWIPRTTTTTRPPTTTTRPPTTTTLAPTTPKAPTTTTTKAPTTTAAPTTTQAPATTVAPPPTGGLTSAQQSEMLSLVNAKRATGTTCGGVAYPAVPALSIQGQLTSAAAAHAKDMATYNYFSHTGRDGSSAGTRITRTGYVWRAWAENIAAGQQTPAAVIQAWFASAGHCQNFMSSNVTQIGFGKAENLSSTYKIYWVADLARPA